MPYGSCVLYGPRHTPPLSEAHLLAIAANRIATDGSSIHLSGANGSTDWPVLVCGEIPLAQERLSLAVVRLPSGVARWSIGYPGTGSFANLAGARSLEATLEALASYGPKDLPSAPELRLALLTLAATSLGFDSELVVA